MARNPHLCLAIVAALGVVALVATVGLIVADVYGRPSPPALVAVVSGCIGSLGSFLVMPLRPGADVAPVAVLPLPRPTPTETLPESPASLRLQRSEIRPDRLASVPTQSGYASS